MSRLPNRYLDRLESYNETEGGKLGSKDRARNTISRFFFSPTTFHLPPLFFFLSPEFFVYV